MSRRTSANSILGSPVLIGSVTVLIVVVAVFLAYNANQGLPFVPTYDVSAELPGGANLVEANDVRVGGFRVGFVDAIRTGVDDRSGRAVAVIDMKLDKTVQPLPKDSFVFVRTRSPIGLKYVELTVGDDTAAYAPGDTIPLERAKRPIELDEFFGTFNQRMRDNQRTSLEGFGDGFAGRGQSLNVAIENLLPLVTHLEPVMRNLSDPDTELDEFFKQAGRTSAQIAPVAHTYASLFENMATTFEALSRSPESLRGTIERSPRTLLAGIRSFPVQRPFLADSERLFAKLIPVADEFRRSLPPTSDALEAGTPVLRRAPALYERTEDVFRALTELVRAPTTLLALKDLTTTFRVVAPLLTYVAPYQTVCNYWVYYWTAISEHLSEPVSGASGQILGTGQRSNLKSDNRTQDNRLSSTEGDRPADVPANQDPQEARDPENNPLVALHSAAYEPAIDAQGNADCQTGQRGYLDGPLVSGGRYPPSNSPAEGGGSHVVLDSDYPGLAGPTYKGVPRLKDVP